MSTKAGLVVLAVAATTLAGCQTGKADTAQPTAGTAPAAAVASSSAPAATGNGVAALSADQILKRATKALNDAGSYRAKGTVDLDGDQTKIDLTVDGDDFTTSMAMGKAEVEMLAADGKQYMRPNKAFWIMATNAQQGKVLAQLIGDRWVSGADKDKSFKELFSIGSATEFLKPTGKVSKGEEKEIGGVPAIGLKDSGDPDSMLYVATTGEPYPLRMTGKGGSTMVFSDFGTDFPAMRKPAASDVLDLNKLGGK